MRYVSRKRELRLIMRPQDRTMDDSRHVVIIRGKKAEFVNRAFETQDPELIDWLHDHPLRGGEFEEVRDEDIKAIEATLRKVRAQEDTQVVTGAKGTLDNPHAEREIPLVPLNYTPATTQAVSPELIEFIDGKINTALGQIMDLLKRDTTKEEKALAGKPLKSFKCKICGEEFASGFKVGEHKKLMHPIVNTGEVVQ